MSSEATGWVWKHSPYGGITKLVHLALADVVNDMHGNLFWASTQTVQNKTGLSRATVFRALGRMVEDGYLAVVTPGGDIGKPTEYRFLTPPRPVDDLPLEAVDSVDDVEDRIVWGDSAPITEGVIARLRERFSPSHSETPPVSERDPYNSIELERNYKSGKADFAAPQQEQLLDPGPVAIPTSGEPNPTNFVGEYLTGYAEASGGSRPSGQWIARVGKEIKRLIADGASADEMTVVAYAAGKEMKPSTHIEYVLNDYRRDNATA